MGIEINPICKLCNKDFESRKNLFFECSYTSDIWMQVGFRAGCQPPNQWDQNLDFIIKKKGKEADYFIQMLAYGVYYIWRERNKRAYGQEAMNASSLFRIIRNCVLD